MELTVIDERDHVGWLASATRIGEVYMTSVRTMVANVLAEIGNASISRLNILDHGNPDGMQIGDDWITVGTLPGFAADLRRLNGHFTADGFVHFQHCKVGQNRPLLIGMANLFGVSVYAGTGFHNPVYRFNTGDYVRCDPGGSCQGDVRRPGTSPPGPSPWDNPNKMCCFPAGTKVQTAQGARPIETIEPGNWVLAWDRETNCVREAKVRRRQEHYGSFPLRSLQAGQGHISVTDGHRFAHGSGVWVASERLTAGDVLSTLAGEVSLTKIGIGDGGAVAEVFNLEVEDLGSYYVGEMGYRVRDH